jgi:hypothetical protein
MPFHAYAHAGNKAITAITFRSGDTWPAGYRNALFFGDYIENSIRIIKDIDQDGRPDPVVGSAAPLFGRGNLFVVDLIEGPGHDLFFVDINNGRVGRVSWDADPTRRNLAPSAAIALGAGSTGDGPPRNVSFTAANSIDPEASKLDFAWDLDGDGEYDDAVGIAVSRDYPATGPEPLIMSVGVRASDASGAMDTAHMIITVLRDSLFVDGFDVIGD